MSTFAFIQPYLQFVQYIHFCTIAIPISKTNNQSTAFQSIRIYYCSGFSQRTALFSDHFAIYLFVVQIKSHFKYESLSLYVNYKVVSINNIDFSG